MDSPTEQIKKKIDIVEFIGSFISLKKSGRNFKAVCPFHQEKTPSFVVSPDRQIWHCFGACQEGGDIFRFLMKWENITFIEALRELAEKTGVKLQRITIEDKVWKKKERLILMNRLAGEYFNFILFKTDFGKKALDYLNKRQINKKIANKFQLGYAPQSWDSLLRFLKKKKFLDEEILEGGLVVKGERGGSYDRFRGRLIFPIHDARGNIIGFSGRTMDEKEKTAKYINTPETQIYHKRESLFGINLAKEAIKKQNSAVLVEGEFDMINPYQHGFENFVAIKGSAVTKEQLMLIKRYTNKIILALDADTAGEEAVKKGISEAEILDFETNVISFDFAKDPDEAIKTDLERFKKAVSKPVPVYDFIIETAKKKYPENDPFSKKRLADEVIVYIEKIRNPIVQSYYVKKLAGILDVNERSIEILIRRTRQKEKMYQGFRPVKKKTDETTRGITVQKYLLSLMFQSKDPYKTSEKIFKIISFEDLIIPSHYKIVDSLIRFQKKYPTGFNLNQFVKDLDKELQPVLDELYLFASTEIGLEKEKLERLIYEVKKIALKKNLGKILSSTEGEKKESEDKIKNLNTQLKEVEKKLTTL